MLLMNGEPDCPAWVAAGLSYLETYDSVSFKGELLTRGSI